jgi:hypothetical protein
MKQKDNGRNGLKTEAKATKIGGFTIYRNLSPRSPRNKGGNCFSSPLSLSEILVHRFRHRALFKYTSFFYLIVLLIRYFWKLRNVLKEL